MTNPDPVWRFAAPVVPLSKINSAILVVLSVLSISSVVRADYLIVSRPATLKTEANRDATVALQLVRGDSLRLLDSEQVDGYYYARSDDGTASGYVYRTLVRRYRSGDATIDGETLSPPSSNAIVADQLTTAFMDRYETDMYVHYISVGQANCALLEFPCGAVLLDTGHYTNRLRDSLTNYLDAFFASRLDLDRTFNSVMISHNHADHTGGLREICSRYRVLNYVDNGQDSSKTQAEIREDFTQSSHPPHVRGISWDDIRHVPGRNGMSDAVIDPIDCENIDPSIRVLAGSFDTRPAGWGSSEFKNPNEHSLVIRVDYGQASLLFTGDLEREAIQELLSYYSGTDLLDVDVYEVGHHGSPNGTTPELLAAMTPDIAVFSAGNSNDRGGGTAFDYGHPRSSIIGLLCDSLRETRSPSVTRLVAPEPDHEFVKMSITKAVFGTGWDGHVVIRASPDGTLRIAVSRLDGIS